MRVKGEIRTKQVKYHSVVLRNTKVRLNGDIAFFTGEYTEVKMARGLGLIHWTRRSFPDRS